jgi:hypothetical protein
MHYARARSRYLAALGLSSLPVALLAVGAVGCQRSEPGATAPTASAPSAIHHTEAWVPAVEPAPAGVRPGTAMCPHGPFCVPQPAGAGDAPAPAPHNACSATVALPKGIGPETTMSGRAPTVAFDDARTTAERAADPAACCYQWNVLCPGGRALRGEDGPVTAPTAGRADWLAPDTLDVSALSPATRAALAAHWEGEAAFEHASVASFARASLALLAVGAPPALVADTHAAAIDEVEHARLTYALASAYGGAPRGPGPLAVGAVPGDASLVTVAVETFVDACAGESAAALLLREAAAGAAHPAVRAILGRIADDEERHAELAFRTVAWALRTGGAAVERALRVAVGELRAELAAPPGGAAAPDLAAHGVLDAPTRAAVRRRALCEVVLPCAEALLAPAAIAAEASALAGAGA